MNQDQEKSIDVITDFFIPDEDKIRLLQSILQVESDRAISLKEAEEVGLQLITLYECLARDRTIVRSSDEQLR